MRGTLGKRNDGNTLDFDYSAIRSCLMGLNMFKVRMPSPDFAWMGPVSIVVGLILITLALTMGVK